MSKGSIDILWKVITAILIPVLFFMATNVIANDKESRQRDDDIKKEIGIKLDKLIDMTGENNVMLASIGTQVNINTKRLDRIENKTR